MSLATLCPHTWQDTRAGKDTSLQYKRPIDPGWPFLCPVLGPEESHQPPHLGNGLLPPRASRKKDPGVTKRQTELGTLRQLHGGQAGRQAGRRGKESLELGKRRGLLQGLLQG